MVRRLLVLAAFALVPAGCASSGPSSPGQMAGVAPMLSVERFLQAANMRDHQAMARIFGTADGPIAEQTGSALGCAFKRMGSWIGLGERCLSWTEIEIRMDAIARILRHDDYRIRGESSVAGRRYTTTRVGVDLVQGAATYDDVAFVVVEAPGGRWYLERIDLERITGGDED